MILVSICFRFKRRVAFRAFSSFNSDLDGSEFHSRQPRTAASHRTQRISLRIRFVYEKGGYLGLSYKLDLENLVTTSFDFFYYNNFSLCVYILLQNAPSHLWTFYILYIFSYLLFRVFFVYYFLFVVVLFLYVYSVHISHHGMVVVPIFKQTSICMSGPQLYHLQTNFYTLTFFRIFFCKLLPLP